MNPGPVQIEFSPLFKRRLKKISPQIKQKLPNLFIAFSQNPFNPRLKTHKLSGKLHHQYTFWIAPNLRIVFSFTDKNHTALFVDIGSHDQVYR